MSVSQKGVDATKLEEAVCRRAQDVADILSHLPGVLHCEVKRTDFSLDRLPTPEGTVSSPIVFRSAFTVLVQALPEQELMLKAMALGLEHGAEPKGEPLPYGQGESYPVYGVTNGDNAYAAAFSDAMKRATARAKCVVDRTGLKLGGVKGVVEEARFGGFNEYGYRGPLALRPVDFAGPFHDSIQVSIKFKITFETK